MRDVTAQRWLAWDEDPQTLELHARRVGPEEVRVELRTPGANGAGPAVEGTVLLGRVPRAAPAARGPGRRAPVALGPDALYRDVMFHQGAWRAVRAVDAVAPRGARPPRCRPRTVSSPERRTPRSCSTQPCSTRPGR